MEFWNKELLAIPGFEVITAGRLIIALSIFLVAYLLSRLAGYLLARRLAGSRLRPDSVHTIKRITFFIVLALTALAILGLFGIPLTAFAFATGAIAIGLGFGAQNIINNFISGWILMAERPIRIDDFVEIDGSQGTVEYIGTRSTRIRRTDGVHMLVPNSHLLERTVVNWTLIDQHIRTTLRVGVEYGSPVDHVATLILQAVTEQDEVNSDPPASVIFEDFGDNALVFEAYFWCDVAGEKAMREIRSQIRFRIADLFANNDIIVAFPQRDVHLDTRKPLEIRLSGDNDR
ncbi:MAG: mechanosensitive ion channel [Gammaproteobacteria bacterium]|nr:mechanosensitive ion channel [Gammaproteobacteria bacterium]